MDAVIESNIAHWDPRPAPEQQEAAVAALERGQVLWLPHLPFEVESAERPLLQPGRAEVSRAKNISLSPDGAELRGVRADAAELQLLRGMVWRFALAARSLVGRLLPGYADALVPGRASFRPVEIAGRTTSWRKDDTRLHVDAFPSSPTGGRRILRVFSNIHPQQQARVWRLGEPFDDVAKRYLPRIGRPPWGSAALLHLLHVTKQRRTAYDHYMLGLHDRMKADLDYQATAPQQVLEFPAGSSWLVFTDQASHAAMRGQHALEQTFMLPVHAMRDEGRSPLRVLEGLLGRSLA